MTVDSGAPASDKDQPAHQVGAPTPEPPPDAPADDPAAAEAHDKPNPSSKTTSPDKNRTPDQDDEPAGEQTDSAPVAGAKPGGVKRRRTASMKVSRPAAEPADDAPPRAELAPPHRILDSAWAVRTEEFLDSPAGTATLLGTAAVSLLLGPLAIYSVFAVVFIFRRPLRARIARLPLGPRTTLGILIVLAGLTRELLTWIAEYAQGDDQTALLHPQLVPHLLITLGIYAAWAVGWGVSLWWYNYRLGEALIIQAVSGLVLENFGQTLLAGLSTLPQGIVLWLYAMAVSAFTLGVAWLLATDKLDTLRERDLDGALRYAAPPLLTGVALVLIFAFWLRLLNGLHAIPEQAPIRERPFW